MAYSSERQYNSQQSAFRYGEHNEPPSPPRPPRYSSLSQESSFGQNFHQNYQPSVPVSQQPLMTPSSGFVGGLNDGRIGRHPPGWEGLLSTDHLLVLQDEDGSSCYGVKNFIIKNQLDQTLYYAREDEIGNWCCGSVSEYPYRPFEMRVFDMRDNQIIHVHRPSLSAWCHTSETVEVSAPPGNVIGIIEQHLRFLEGDTINIVNRNGETVLQIKCPIHVGLRADREFCITSADGNTRIGKISRIKGELMREMFGRDYYNFEITFPIDLDAHVKAIILGSCFLIKCLYFERS